MPADAAPGQTRAHADARRNVADILPLRPVQKALMLYAMTEEGRARGGDPGCIQVQFGLRGDLHVETLRQAWQAVIAHHAALRMSVRALPGRDPLVIVWKTLTAPWDYRDWHDLTGERFAARHRDLLQEDRRRGLDIATTRTVRLTVLRRTDRQHEVVMTCHHLFLDGWSSAIVVNDLLAAYNGLATQATPGLAVLRCDQRDYHAWLNARDRTRLEAFWRETLAGATPLAPLRLGPEPLDAEDATRPHGRALARLGDAASRTIAVACQSGITPNALVQGAWALLLGILYSQDDVMFGTTVSGRPPDLDGIDALAGMFTANLPVRIRIAHGQRVAPWLQQIRDTQLESNLHADADLADIQGWLGISAARPLFDTLVVVENFPWRARSGDGPIALHDYRSDLLSLYPATLSVIPGAPWSLGLTFARDRVGERAADALLAVFGELIGHLAGNLQAPVDQVIDWLGDRMRGLTGLAAVAAPAASARHPSAPEAFTPAHDPTQLRLSAIWEEVLGISPIGIRDDFFALGGRSMDAVRLVSVIEQRLGIRIPLATLLERPDIERLAGLIDSGESSPWQSLVPIQAGDGRTPLFCVHAGGDHVLFYRHLVRRLGSTRPVFGLQPPGLDGGNMPLGSIGEIADIYVDELCQARPQGPYVLLGYCIGATVALEMARRLERDGRSDVHLIVLDSGFWWGQQKPPVAPPVEATRRPIRMAKKMQKILQDEGIRPLVGLVARNLQVHYSTYRREAIRRWQLRFGDIETQRALWREEVEQACNSAFQRYVPRPCQAAATLVRTAENAAMESKDRHLRWREVTGQLDVRVIPGQHLTLLEEPTVARVAQIVTGHLRAADRT